MICVDAIVKSKSISKENWKFPVIMYLSAFLALIFMSIVIVLEKCIPSFNFTNETSYYNKLIPIFLFLVPALLVNYFLIFYRNKYEILLQKYKPNNGKYIIGFMIFSIVLVLICIFI